MKRVMVAKISIAELVAEAERIGFGNFVLERGGNIIWGWNPNDDAHQAMRRRLVKRKEELAKFLRARQRAAKRKASP